MVHSFLMIGQSNMAGRGFLKDVPPIRDERIKMLRNGRWQVMTEPINYDRPFSGIGPAASFALAWCQGRENPEEEIGLIPCADGGSSLDEWMPGGALFDHAVMQSKLAQRISRIDGILWHQGETDCLAERAALYEEKLEKIMFALRHALGLPHTPLLVGGLGDYLSDCGPDGPYANAPKVTAQLRHFAESRDNCFFVTAQGLTCNPDKLHFDAASQRIFGLRYFAAYHERRSVTAPPLDERQRLDTLTKAPDQPPEQTVADLFRRLAEGEFANSKEQRCLERNGEMQPIINR